MSDADKTARNERLWMRYYRLSPTIGKDTLAAIVDEETANLRKWLIRAEKFYLARYPIQVGDRETPALVAGYLAGCISGALSGKECPGDEDAGKTQNQS